MFIFKKMKMSNMFISALLLTALLMSNCQGEEKNSQGGGEEPDTPEVVTEGAKVYTTTADGGKLFEESVAAFGQHSSMSPYIVDLLTDDTYQTIDGFGCAMTGATCYNILQMSQADRTAFLKEIFSVEEGLGSSLIRVTIGSSDFGLDEYTWCDTEGIENFAMHSLCKRDVIPVLKEVYAINPNVRIIASPWSAPRWMKRAANGDDNTSHYQWTGGRLKTKYYQDYAQYFVKWIQTMEDEGFDIYAMTIQNEPLNAGNSMSMLMYWDEQRDFIKTALGPAFEEAGIDTKILVFDHNYNYDNISSQNNYPLNIYADAEASKYIAGSAWHNYGGNVSELDDIVANAPSKEIYFTEASIGTWNYSFESCLINDYNNIFMETLKRGGKGVTLWNLVLDSDKGPYRPGGCSTCYGAVTYMKNGKMGDYRSHYYNMAHASKVIRQGAVRIGTKGYTVSGVPYLAFKNPDGSFGVIIDNTSAESAAFVFRDSKQTVRVEVPAKSLVSVKW